MAFCSGRKRYVQRYHDLLNKGGANSDIPRAGMDWEARVPNFALRDSMKRPKKPIHESGGTLDGACDAEIHTFAANEEGT